MKKLLLACCLTGLVAAAHAQPPTMPADGPPSPQYKSPHYKTHHGKRWNAAAIAEHMQKTLQLNNEQTTEIKKILENSAAQRKVLFTKYKPQLEAFHADMKKLRRQTRTEIEGVLTPKQKEALKAQWQMREHRRPHHGPMRDSAPSK